MLMQGFGERFKEQDIEGICKTAQAAGINFYDTAEVYGYQNTEQDASSECLVRRYVVENAAKYIQKFIDERMGFFLVLRVAI